MAEENAEQTASTETGDTTTNEEIDVGALQSSLATATKKQGIEREHRLNAEKKYETLNADFEALKAKIEQGEHEKLKKDADKSGDYEAIKANFADTIANKESAFKEREESLLSEIETLRLGSEVSKLAAQTFGEDAELLEHVYKSQLKMISGPNGHEVIVVDAKGADRGISLDELKSETMNNPKYARYVVGSTASGGGATGSSASKNGGAGQNTMKRSDFYSLPEPERKSFMKEGGKLN